MGCSSSLIEVPLAYRSNNEIKSLNAKYSAHEINAMESYIAIHQTMLLARYCSDFNYEYKYIMSDLDKKFTLQIKDLAQEGKQLFDSGEFLYIKGDQHMILNGKVFSDNEVAVKYTKLLLDNSEKKLKLEFNKLSDGNIHLECQKLKNLIK